MSMTVKNLKKGVDYYVRIRARKTISGKKFSSQWSDVQKVKITK